MDESTIDEDDNTYDASRQTAALDFLGNIVLGPTPGISGVSEDQSVPDDAAENTEIKDGPDARGLQPDTELNEASGSLAVAHRPYTYTQQAAVDFLNSINLDADGSAPTDTTDPLAVGDQSYNSVPGYLDGAFTGNKGPTSAQGTLHRPSFQVYSGKVLRRQGLYSQLSGSGNSTDPFNAMLDRRVMTSTAKGTPMSLYSVIPYKEQKAGPRRRRTSSAKYLSSNVLDRVGFTLPSIDAVKRKKTEQSFARLLEPDHTLEPKSTVNSTYHPFLLDDPELKTGKHRTVITLPSYMGSIIQYSKPSDIRAELNGHFKETHPSVHDTLTLTQIRRLKDRLLKIAEMQDLELSSVACSYVYFEKLVLKGMVDKDNRRLFAGVCLFLAAKVNDPKELDYTKLLEAIEKVLDVPPKEIMASEFSIYSSLEFTLYIPLWEVMPHLERILSSAGISSIEDYVGNKAFFTHTF